MFLCQMKELIMNPEKLAKLQAQVRIGGKVRLEKCYLVICGKMPHGDFFTGFDKPV